MQAIPFNRRHVLGAVAAALCAPLTWAQSVWPTKPIKLFVPYPAGGAPDTLTRSVAEQLGNVLPGSSIVIENRPGASGLLGARAVSQAPADGHALVYVSSGHVTLAAMNPKFELLKELKPLIRLSASPFVVLVATESPYKTMEDLIRFVQANPGKVNCGTAGPGSPSHMAVEYLEESTKNFKTTLVPFKGAVESINAIMGGHIDMTIGVLGAAVSLIQGGKLRVLAVTTPKRVPLLPNVPTVAEAGGGDYAYQAWGGFMVHPDTPDDVVLRLQAAFQIAMQSDGVKKTMAATGGVPDISASPEAFGAQMARDLTREQLIVKRLGMTMTQ